MHLEQSWTRLAAGEVPMKPNGSYSEFISHYADIDGVCPLYCSWSSEFMQCGVQQTESTFRDGEQYIASLGYRSAQGHDGKGGCGRWLQRVSIVESDLSLRFSL